MAFGAPSSRNGLTISQLEELPDQKADLHELLREASGLQGRRRRQFLAGLRARRFADFIDDFSPLRELAAFRALEDELGRVIEARHWCTEV